MRAALGSQPHPSLAFRLWFAAGLLLLLASGSAFGLMPFMGFFILVAWLAWGVPVWIHGLLSASGDGRGPVGEPGRGGWTRWLRPLLAPPLVVLLLWALSGPALTWSSTLWAHVELRRHRAQYLGVVEGLAGGDATPELGLEPSFRLEVDEGPPVRVAFPWGTGLVDNWRAIVHDPSGLVLRAEDAWHEDADDPEAFRARDLFGGHIVRCVHLSGPFYLCVFT